MASPVQPPAGTPEVIRLTITDRDGSDPVTLDATVAAPALAVHRAKCSPGWSLTHVPTGRAAGWWPEDDDSSRAMACGVALAGLGSWETADLQALPLDLAPLEILKHGGWVPTRDPAEYFVLEDGERVRISCVGAVEKGEAA